MLQGWGSTAGLLHCRTSEVRIPRSTPHGKCNRRDSNGEESLDVLVRTACLVSARSTALPGGLITQVCISRKIFTSCAYDLANTAFKAVSAKAGHATATSQSSRSRVVASPSKSTEIAGYRQSRLLIYQIFSKPFPLAAKYQSSIDRTTFLIPKAAKNYWKSNGSSSSARRIESLGNVGLPGHIVLVRK